jgi:hypothetical protein
MNQDFTNCTEQEFLALVGMFHDLYLLPTELCIDGIPVTVGLYNKVLTFYSVPEDSERFLEFLQPFSSGCRDSGITIVFTHCMNTYLVQELKALGYKSAKKKPGVAPGTKRGKKDDPPALLPYVLERHES